jgi:hypothetical protein
VITRQIPQLPRICSLQIRSLQIRSLQIRSLQIRLCCSARIAGSLKTVSRVFSHWQH